MLIGLAGCATSHPAPRAFPEAQAIVDEIMVRHSDLVRLTIHAVPAGGHRSRVIASTYPGKLNQWSDPEDVETLETGEPVEMTEGADLDYTAPVLDSSGAVIAAVGVTVTGTARPAMLASAKEIAGETSRAIVDAPGKLW